MTCSREGAGGCVVGYTVVCCNGVLERFLDGVCLRDAGRVPEDTGTSCDLDPRALGCPCATEGERICRGIHDYTFHCRDGVWQFDGLLCCPPP